MRLLTPSLLTVVLIVFVPAVDSAQAQAGARPAPVAIPAPGVVVVRNSMITTAPRLTARTSDARQSVRASGRSSSTHARQSARASGRSRVTQTQQSCHGPGCMNVGGSVHFHLPSAPAPNRAPERRAVMLVPSSQVRAASRHSTTGFEIVTLDQQPDLQSANQQPQSRPVELPQPSPQPRPAETPIEQSPPSEQHAQPQTRPAETPTDQPQPSPPAE